MCDEYDDERMAVFWRRLEPVERREQLSPEPEEAAELLVHIEPAPTETPKPQPRAVVR